MRREKGTRWAVLIGAFLPWMLGCQALPGSAVRVQETEDPRILRDGPDADYETAYQMNQGVAFQVRGHLAGLEGNFDGDTSLLGPDTIAVPDTDAGTGYEVAVGLAEEYFLGWLSYRRTDFDASVGGSDSAVEMHMFALQAEISSRANEAVQPYAFFEGFFATADLEDASTDGINVGDAKLRDGFGLGLGGGVRWWSGGDLAFDVRALVDWVGFGRAEGVAGDAADIDDEVDGFFYGLSVGVTWIP